MKFLYDIYPAGQFDSLDNLSDFIRETDHLFIPRLSSYVSLVEWSEKLYRNATLFIVRDTVNNEIIACNAVYVNKAPQDSYATFLAVKEKYANYGIGAKLIIKAIRYCKDLGSSGYALQMRASNEIMYNFYLHLGFKKITEEKYPNSEEVKYNLRISF